MNLTASIIEQNCQVKFDTLIIESGVAPKFKFTNFKNNALVENVFANFNEK